jgi:hypothetical protein
MLFGKLTRSEEKKMQQPAQDAVQCVSGTETEGEFSLSAFESCLKCLDARLDSLKGERSMLTERLTLLGTAAGVTASKLRGDDPEVEKRKVVQRLRFVESAISGVRSELTLSFSRARTQLDAAKGRIWARIYSEIVAPYEVQLSRVLELEPAEAVFVLTKLKPSIVTPELDSEVEAFESLAKAFNESVKNHGASHTLAIADENLPKRCLERTLQDRLAKVKRAVIPPADRNELFASMFRAVADEYHLPVGQVAVDPVKLDPALPQIYRGQK